MNHSIVKVVVYQFCCCQSCCTCISVLLLLKLFFFWISWYSCCDINVIEIDLNNYDYSSVLYNFCFPKIVPFLNKKRCNIYNITYIWCSVCLHIMMECMLIFFFSIKFIKYTNENFDYAKLTKKINPIFRV